jgi:hypothetical protein
MFTYVLYRYQLHDIAIGFFGVRLPEWATEIGSKSCLRLGPICDPTPGVNGLNLGGKWWLIFRLGYLVHGDIRSRVRGFRGGMREAMPPGGRQGEGGRGHQGNRKPVYC